MKKNIKSLIGLLIGITPIAGFAIAPCIVRNAKKESLTYKNIVRNVKKESLTYKNNEFDALSKEVEKLEEKQFDEKKKIKEVCELLTKFYHFGYDEKSFDYVNSDDKIHLLDLMVVNYLKAENDLNEVLEENLNSLNGLLTTIDSNITLNDEAIVGAMHWLMAHNDENEIDLEAKEKIEKLGYVYSNELNSLNWQNKKIKYSKIVKESEKDKKLLKDEKNKYEAELKKVKNLLNETNEKIKVLKCAGEKVEELKKYRKELKKSWQDKHAAFIASIDWE